MDTIGKEFETNRDILDADIQDQEKWEQNVEGWETSFEHPLPLCGLLKPGSMSESSNPSSSIQLKQWFDNKWVIKEHFKRFDPTFVNTSQQHNSVTEYTDKFSGTQFWNSAICHVHSATKKEEQDRMNQVMRVNDT